MELKDLEEAIENMIVQHDYPGFEPRSLNLALPTIFSNASAGIYAKALKSDSVYVQLAALRWFHNKPGLAKTHAKLIATHLENTDPWVRTEATRTIEITKTADINVISSICHLLKDLEPMVRMEAAKALGNLGKEITQTGKSTNFKGTLAEKTAAKEQIIKALKESSEDSVLDVRRKVIKSLRKLGAFSNS